MKYLKIGLLLSLLTNHSISAEENPSAADVSKCASISSTKDIVRCALERHPSILRAMAERDHAAKAEGKASSIPNPEASTTTTYGKSLGDKLWTFEASLDQKVEIGGKRSSRIKLAQSENELAEGSLKKAQEEVFLEMVHSLNRHRQIHEEMELINEAVSAFQRVKAIYEKRGRLSAEQKVSSDLFELSIGEHRLRRAKIQGEKDALSRHFELILGQNLPEDEKFMPKFRKSWPEIAPANEVKSGEIQIATAQFKAAEAEWKAQKAESYPDITIGPVFEWEREGPTDVYRYGLNLSLPLPLWNWNRSGRAYAERGKIAAERHLEFTKKEAQSERQQHIDKYKALVGALAQAPDLKNLETKHRRIETLFEQGLVSTSLFIEAHRQIQEFTESRNEQEHEANDALWKIYALDGRMFEEELWNSNF